MSIAGTDVEQMEGSKKPLLLHEQVSFEGLIYYIVIIIIQN